MFYDKHLKSGKLKKDKFDGMAISSDKIWQCLESNGYIDSDGAIQNVLLLRLDDMAHFETVLPTDSLSVKKIIGKIKRAHFFSSRYWVKEWGEPIVVAFMLAMLIKTFLVQPFKIPTGSMRMTFIEKDRILVNRLLYRFDDPERGDIVVFKYPVDRKRAFIKRLIGLPGDIVEIKEGKIYINGEIVTDPRIRKNYYYNRDDWQFGRRGMKINVPENKYFVLGDNSAHSSDSRNWGFVDRKDFLGRSFFIYWPPTRWKVPK